MSSTPHRRNGSSRRRGPLWAWALILAFVAGTWASHWHAASEVHELCEHGEWTHGASGHAAQDGSHDHGPQWVPGEGSEQAHDHCGLWLATLRPSLDTRTKLEPAARAPARGFVPDLPAGPRAASFPLFLLAPSQSPPAA